MFHRDVVTSREVSYQKWMLVHSMMSGCAGLFRQTSCIVQFYKYLKGIVETLFGLLVVVRDLNQLI